MLTEDESEDDCVWNRALAKKIACDLSDEAPTNKNNRPSSSLVEKRQRITAEINSRQAPLKVRLDTLPSDVTAPMLKRPRTDASKSVDAVTHRVTGSFSGFSISRPLLKALTTMGLVRPTAIQEATIPAVLQGRDVCGCAITGSGKTLAYLIPIAERLLYRPRLKQTRVLILSPTRELAMQICAVMKDLCQYFPRALDVCMAVGGFDVKSQEQALKLSPDVVIATPGRLIDHLHNSPSFSLSTIEILVLDEADRMMDEYFADQMHELIRICSSNRQTLLFSATLSDDLMSLSSLSLANPVRICVDKGERVAPGIRQEFVRIRTNQEKDREAILLALITRVCLQRTMVFVQTKKQCHRFSVLFNLLEISAGELHGAISQEQRNATMDEFRSGSINVLLATDLAARGLDIFSVHTVINFTMPNTVKHYIHRVGRTARAGQLGRSISLCGDSERRMLKDIVKLSDNASQIVRRTIPAAVIAKMRARINSANKSVEEILELEKSDHLMKVAENELAGLHSKKDALTNEFASRSLWFQTAAEKRASARNTRSRSTKASKPKREKPRLRNKNTAISHNRDENKKKFATSDTRQGVDNSPLERPAKV